MVAIRLPWLDVDKSLESSCRDGTQFLITCPQAVRVCDKSYEDNNLLPNCPFADTFYSWLFATQSTTLVCSLLRRRLDFIIKKTRVISPTVDDKLGARLV